MVSRAFGGWGEGRTAYTLVDMLAEDTENALAEILMVDWRDGEQVEVN